MIETLYEVVQEAGRRILTYFEHPISVVHKADASPLTEADRASHTWLVERLTALFPDIPVLSEESPPETYTERFTWRRFWLIDPLDGTKEFIKRTGEFTVNVALIEDRVPVAGIVYVPVMGRAYVAERGKGAFRLDDEHMYPIRTRPAGDTVRVVASKDHQGPLVCQVLERIPGAEIKHMGSSLKFCLVAEGEADLYIRDTPTMEWDTAAAQCVVEVAGGQVLTLEGEPLQYNKPELKNPPLVTIGDPGLPWQKWLATP